MKSFLIGLVIFMIVLVVAVTALSFMDVSIEQKTIVEEVNLSVLDAQ